LLFSCSPPQTWNWIFPPLTGCSCPSRRCW
jgi:hypothetical protein